MIRIGIIGAGPNAAGHAKYFSKSGRARLVAVADVDLPRAEALATECGGAQAVGDYREFLDRVDAVVISSPNFLHRDQAVAAARAGKHVYCEKPMGLTVPEAQDIVDAVTEAGVKSAVGFSVRFDKTTQTMARLLREGSLGKLVSVCSRRLMMIPLPTGGWRADPRKSGGLLMEINIHEIDWILSMGGELQSLYARRYTAQNTADPLANDHLWVTFNFANGAIGSHEGGWQSPVIQFFRSVSGTEGGISTDEWGNTLYRWKLDKSRDTLPPDAPFDLRGHFLDCIEHDATPVADVRCGLRVTQVCAAVLESCASGQPVTMPIPAKGAALPSPVLS